MTSEPKVLRPYGVRNTSLDNLYLEMATQHQPSLPVILEVATEVLILVQDRSQREFDPLILENSVRAKLQNYQLWIQ
jgi:hypothetical protein